MTAVFTITGGFVDGLAAGLLAQAEGDPLALGAMTVLLPTRRACRALREAFLRLAGPVPLLLPRMAPIGDIDAEAIGLGEAGADGLGEGALDLAPPMPPLRRQMLLARLILRRPDGVAPDQAMRLAAALARLLDEVGTEGLDFAGLADLVPEELAEHWQETLRFLEIVTEAWPLVLEEAGALDPAERTRRLFALQVAAWGRDPPRDPVVAAGMVGSIPASAMLIEAVARLPRGVVVLPGLDRGMDDAIWDALDDVHPQLPLKLLLERLGVERRAVADWPGPCLDKLGMKESGSSSNSLHPEPVEGRRGPDRTVLWREVMRPAATTEAWRRTGGAAQQGEALDAAALDGLLRIDCPTPQEEAGVIALLLREALETPGRTAALVTPDRGLGRRVAGALARWGVRVDDSGGRPLADTAVGSYLRLLADCAFRAASPLALLALLKHPLAAGGEAPPMFRARVRALERAALRGPAPSPGLAGIREALRLAPAQGFTLSHDRASLLSWFDRLAARLTPLHDAVSAAAAEPVELLVAHIATAEALAATADTAGAARLWRHDDGEAGQRLCDELLQALSGFPAIAGRDWPGLFEAALDGAVVRPRWGTHPRLAILGPLEARLERFDLAVLGGLNEGTWPAAPPADPWLSRPMRSRFGLSAPERRIGIAASDFAQAAAGPRVVLTRATRVEGAPTVPSRWLLRLDAVLEGAGMALPNSEAALWLDLARRLDAPAAIRPVRPPEPRPPVAARPRRLSVTAIATWMADPYALYARYVLDLEKLDPIETEPGAADRGQVVHDALARFVAEHREGPLPEDALERLLACGRAAFDELPSSPDITAFWWPRFERMARWFVREEAVRRAGGIRPLALEAAGRMVLTGPAGDFVLTGRADRIDRLASGGLEIIDYKTGTVPSNPQIEAGFAPQLPLEAAMVESGAFEGVPADRVAALAHWKLSGGALAGEIKAVETDDLEGLVAAARDGLAGLIARFDDPATPYLSQPRKDPPRYSDYGHLARVKEWSAGEPDEA